MSLLSRGQVKNPIALHSLLSDMLTEIENLAAEADALVIDVTDQRVSIEQGRVDSIASKAEIDKMFTDVTAVEAETDGGAHGTTTITSSQLGSLTQVATETLVGATAAASIITQRRGEGKSTDPAIK